MNIEARPLGIKERRSEGKWILHQIEMSRRVIKSPEYFYQHTTPEQEERWDKRDYSYLWERVAKLEHISVPKSIKTFFGKVEFIRDEMHFKEFCTIKFDPSEQRYQDFKDHLVKYKALHKERKKAFKKLNSLSPKEVEALKTKTANIPLQLIDFPTGKLISLPADY